MNASTKRILSTLAIIIASVAPVPSGTIPAFADVAARVAPAVVSITTTEVVKTTQNRGFGIDPFEFFFPSPQQSPNRQNPHRQQMVPRDDSGDDEHSQRAGGSGFIISPAGSTP